MPLFLNEELTDQIEAQRLHDIMRTTDWGFEVFKENLVSLFQDPDTQEQFQQTLSWLAGSKDLNKLKDAVSAILIKFQALELQARILFKEKDIEFPEIIDELRQLK